MKFTDRVLKLINEKGITKNKMLNDLHLGSGTFATWESRGTTPGGDYVKKIAEYFNVSTDYLLGNASDSDNKFLIDYASQAIVSNILDLKNQKGLSDETFLADLGFSTDTISNWKKGRSHSFLKNLESIAEYLETTEQNLLSGFEIEQKNIPAEELDEDSKKIEMLIDQLSSENLDRAMDYIDLLLSNQDKE